MADVVVNADKIQNDSSKEQQQSLLVDISIAKGQGRDDGHVDEGVVVSPPSAPIVNNYMNGLSNGIAADPMTKGLAEDQGQGFKATSPPDTADTGYEFDPLCTQLSNEHSLHEELSESTSDKGAAVLIDLETSNSTSSYSSNDIHDASTASITPQSPPSCQHHQQFDESESANQKSELAADLLAFQMPPPAEEGSRKTEDGHEMLTTEIAVQQTGDGAEKPPEISDVEIGGRIPEKHVTFQSAGETSASEDPPTTSETSQPALKEVAASSATDSPRESKIPVAKSPPASPTKIPELTKKSTSRDGAAPSQAPAKPPRAKTVPSPRKSTENLKSSAIPSPKREKKPKDKDGASDSGIEEEKATPQKSSAEKKTPDSRTRPEQKKVSVSTSRSAANSTTAPTKSAATPTSTRSGSATRITARSKVKSLEYASHKPGGGNVKIVHKSVDVSNVQSKCGSKDNIKHTPKGGEKKIESKKLDFSKVESRCGSKDNIKHTPGGGAKKIESQKLEWKVQSKVGSMDNATHRPRGGDKKIESHKLDFKDKAQPKVGSKDNIQHKAGGGEKKIENRKLDFKEKAAPKVGSKDNIDHKPAGGEKKIETVKLDFKDKAEAKVGSKDNIDHKPTGGEIKIESHKLDFKEKAQPRTDTGTV